MNYISSAYAKELYATCLLVASPIVTIAIHERMLKFFRENGISLDEPKRILPRGAWKVFSLLSRPGTILINRFHSLVTSKFLSEKRAELLFSNIIGPIFEEFELRWALQYLALTAAPSFLLRRIAPGYDHLVFALAAKVARVFITAVIFALGHTEYWEEERTWNSDVNHLFITGLLYSGLREYTGKLYYSSVAHIANNLAIEFHNR